jgi:hypothetical protein
MTQKHHTNQFTRTEEAITVLFCLIDDAYAILNPRGRRYESLKRLSDSEIITLALFQHLRGIESERSFLRDAERFFSDLFPGVIGLAPSSFHRRLRKLRCFLEPAEAWFPRMSLVGSSVNRASPDMHRLSLNGRMKPGKGIKPPRPAVKGDDDVEYRANR